MKGRTAMATEAQVLDAMMQVEDPELGVNVVDLGLIYGVDFEEEGHKVRLDMTLTTASSHTTTSTPPTCNGRSSTAPRTSAAPSWRAPATRSASSTPTSRSPSTRPGSPPRTPAGSSATTT